MDPYLCTMLVRVAWVLALLALGAGLSLAMTTYHLFRRTKFLTARLEYEQQRRIAVANETWRTASTAYAAAEPTTLDDLLSSAERDFSLRSSKR